MDVGQEAAERTYQPRDVDLGEGVDHELNEKVIEVRRKPNQRHDE